MPVHRRFLSRAAGALVLAGLLLCSACVINLGGFWDGETNARINGVSIVVRDDRVFADGVELTHRRWESVGGTLDPAGAVKLATATGELTLDGRTGDAWQLEALVFSELAGDGVVGFVDGSLTVTPGAGRKAIIDGVRGTLPAGLAVDVTTGTGTLRLAGFDGGRDLRLQGGTGLIVLKAAQVGVLRVESGTAEIELSDVRGAELDLNTGTGDVLLTDCDFDKAWLESGTADLGLRGGRVGKLEADTGTGDVELRGTRVGHLSVESGTGDVLLAEGATADAISTDLGTGDLLRR